MEQVKRKDHMNFSIFYNYYPLHIMSMMETHAACLMAAKTKAAALNRKDN